MDEDAHGLMNRAELLPTKTRAVSPDPFAWISSNKSDLV
jgi:hypothetical protein